MRDSVENSSSLFNSTSGEHSSLAAQDNDWTGMERGFTSLGKDTNPQVSLLSVAAISGSQISELLSRHRRRSHEIFNVFWKLKWRKC